MEEITPGLYKHFRGKEVRVIGIGHHSETLEKLVFYQETGINKEFGPQSLWVRPVEMFLEIIERDGKTVQRFKRIK